MKIKKLLVVLTVSSVAAGLGLWSTTPEPQPFTGHGDPHALSDVYTQWKAGYEQNGGAEILRLSLGYSKAQSIEHTQGHAQVSLNLLSGELRAVASNLADGEYDLWLVAPDKAEAAGKSFKVGRLQPSARGYSLSTKLQREALGNVQMESIAISKADAPPQEAGLLFGSPSLMQRLYYNERFIPVAQIAPANSDQVLKTGGAAFDFLLPKAALAATNNQTQALAGLIARGQQLFTQETFGGNGRTCSTCHRPDNNHTIDPAYIAKLPRHDPLFVAETNPKLAGLEKAELVRQFALFQANSDGFDKPPVFRSASHLLGMSKSLTFERLASKGEFVEDENYFLDHDGQAQQDNRHTQAIGWSQDGAPDGGSLRDFAKGAIIQHMPKSLERVAGRDFRLPTPDELDALEAYMLSLGRTQEINLAAMTFKSPIVQKGKQLFDTRNNPGQTLDGNGYPNGGTPTFGKTANCNGCHMNAGAISSTTGGNPTRDTGVERMRDQLHHLVDSTIAYDGGFGQQLQNDCGPDYNQACYSDGSTDPRGVRPANHPRLNRFNTPSLIEAADTAPFFHNNSVTTLEEAVAYYNTEAFNTSPGAFTSKGINRQIKIDSSQVVAVALFLRSINVLENIRSSTLMDQKAMTQSGAAASETLRLAASDTEDAIQVLKEAVINPYPDATKKLELALQLEQQATNGFFFAGRTRAQLLLKVQQLKAEAKDLIVSGG